MSLAPVITVDGPSGVGKGMVTRWLAAETGYHRLDSGALYRILALASVEQGIPLEEVDAVAALAGTLDIRFEGETEDDEAILVVGNDWTHRVRTEETGALASRITGLMGMLSTSRWTASVSGKERAFHS